MSVLSSTPRPRGRLVDVGGGRRLHALMAGPTGATPLVILEAGAFGFSADWATVQDQLAAAGFRSLAYDRAGLGFSDPAPEPRDATAVSADLDSLLAALGEGGPFIYCGHSMAGLHARLFAARHPTLLVGLVLVDATTPEAIEIKALARLVAVFALLCEAAAVGSAFGLFRPFAALGLGNAIGVKGPADVEKRWAFADPGHNRWAALEVASWIASAREALGAGPFDTDLPITAVLAGGRNASAQAGDDAGAGLAGGSGHIIRVEGATHASLLGPTYADAIISAVALVRDAGAGSLERAGSEQDAVA